MKTSIRFPDFRSGNLKSKTYPEQDRRTQKLKWLKLSVMAVVLLFLGAVAQAQQQAKTIPRIGVLRSDTPTTFASRNEAFQQGLRELGYVDRKNVFIEYRYAETNFDRLPSLAAELVSLEAETSLGRPTSHRT